MIKYLKDVSKHIPLIISVFMIFFCFSTFAVGGNYDSSDVKYDNSNTDLESTTVEGAIDELYEMASDYSIYNTRVTAMENTIGTSTLTTTAQTIILAINEINARFNSSGVLNMANGGTGATTKAAARTALGVPHTSDIPSKSKKSITYMGLTVVFHKYGNIVNIVMDGEYDSNGSTSSLTSSIKEKIAPANGTYCAVHSNVNASGIYINIIRVSIDGSGTLSFTGGDGKWYHGSFSYIAMNNTPL